MMQTWKEEVENGTKTYFTGFDGKKKWMYDEYWMLDENNVPRKPTTDEEARAAMTDRRKRRVALTYCGGTVHVSTVFLCLDHNYADSGSPILWETMVFGGKLNEEMDRYSSYEDAVKGHEEMVERVKKAEGIV